MPLQRTQTIAWLFILPSLALALLVTAYPAVEMLRMSVHDVSRFGLFRSFVGLGNFQNLWNDPVFTATLIRTLWWTLGVVGGTILVSVPVALILNEDFIGRGIARTIIMLPWAVSLTMTAIVWRWGFNSDYGMLNVLLTKLGLSQQPIPWLATPDLAFPVEIAIGVLVSIPFTVTIFLGGLSSIPSDLYEAAMLDGASRWQCFKRLTLPLMMPFINIAIVLNLIYVFNSFPIIWVMTQGGPSNGTHILVTYLYELGFRLGRPGEAAAVSLVMLATLLLITGVYLRMLQRQSASQSRATSASDTTEVTP